MSKMDKFKTALEKAQADQKAHQANPDSAAAKKTARTAGLISLVLGALFSAGSYYLYTEQGRVSVFLVAIALTGVGLGAYMLLMGKMPQPRS